MPNTCSVVDPLCFPGKRLAVLVGEEGRVSFLSTDSIYCPWVLMRRNAHAKKMFSLAGEGVAFPYASTCKLLLTDNPFGSHILPAFLCLGKA